MFKNHAEYFGDSCKHDLGQTSFEIVNNHDWYKDLKLLDFLANTGRQFRINHMLKKKSVADRLEMEDVGMSLTEFTYQTFQVGFVDGFNYVNGDSIFKNRLMIGCTYSKAKTAPFKSEAVIRWATLSLVMISLASLSTRR